MDPLDEPPVADKLQRLAGTMDSIAHHAARLARVNNSIVDFNEGFAAFLYGMEMSMFCTEFVATPSDDDLRVHARKLRRRQLRQRLAQLEHDNAMLEAELDQLRADKQLQTNDEGNTGLQTTSGVAQTPAKRPRTRDHLRANGGQGRTPTSNGDGDVFATPQGPPLTITASTKSASALPAKRQRPLNVWERLSRSKRHPGSTPQHASTSSTPASAPPRRPPSGKGPRSNRAAELRAQQTRQRLADRMANGRR
ncbi:hypothetical protein DIURU_001787 [Diutina rugosa]|uniref:DASH complex subunit DAM1 n=1 Tax=Diutina rugosa TaxID=5481 RepID=A0A642UT46_DIURU|nr:uncharacterized protein DIURU_001787 [Diutina rugosa]KAA8904833.1 hypothetical protein DIURU_001787 [Diutina rugosa]